MPTGQRAGYQTHWTRCGHGPREALMIHCSLGHAGTWKGVCAALDNEITATAFDIPGHGKSGDWDARGDIQQQTTNIAAELIADMNEDRVDVIGHSFGATVALRLAVERPDILRSLTLIEPVFFAAVRGSGSQAVADEKTRYGAFVDQLERGDRAKAAQEFCALWGDGNAWENYSPVQRDYIVDRIDLIEHAGVQLYGDAAGMMEQLAEIDVPVLIINAAASPPVIGEVCAKLAQAIATAQRETVKGAGHMVPITHPKPVATLISAFLKSSA